MANHVKPFGFISCGTGGQGTVLMSNIVGEACAQAGVRVLSGEMHGLAQRSGSVIIHQRVGEGIMSPLIPWGEADAILSLELIESLRHLFYLKPGGVVLTNSRLMHPPGESQELVRKKIDKYISSGEVIAAIGETDARLIQVDALGLANEAGNALTENVVMVGALAALPEFPLEKDVVMEAMKFVVPPKAVDENVRAFENGYGACRGKC